MARPLQATPDIMTPDQYCQDKAAHSGSSFYYSFLFLPEERRRGIIALYAFCREVDDIVDAGMETAISRTKLQWWREEIERLFQGHPQHPVTLALLPVLSWASLQKTYFHEIIDGMEMDIEQSRYASFTELEHYCYRVASVVGLLSAEIFGYTDKETLVYARDLGMALQLTNIIRDVYEDIRRGRVYLPQDELQRYGVSETTLRTRTEDIAFTELMAFQTQRAYHYYDQALQHLPEVDRYPQRAGIIMASIYRTTLREIEKDQYRVLRHRISLTPLRKLWIAWRTLRLEKKRHKQLMRQ